MVLFRNILFMAALGLQVLLQVGCASAKVIKDKTIYSDLFPQQTSRSDYYLDLGLGYLNESKFDEAVEHFKLSLMHNPENTEARYWLAVTYFRRDQDNLALLELEQLDKAGAKEYASLKLMSDIYEKAQSYEKVISVNERLFALQKENFPLWKMYQMNLNLNRLNQAEKDLARLDKNGEDPFRTHLGRYEIFESQKKYELALVELQKAEQAKPFDRLTMEKIVALDYKLKKWQDVAFLGTKYSKYHPYNEDLSVKLSQAFIQIAHYDDAIAELKKQKENDPKSVGIEFKIAHVLFLKQDFKNAEELYKELYAITKSDQSVFYISQIHLMQNDISSASSSLENLASWSEYYPNAQVQLARLEWKNDHFDLAMNRLRRAHLLRPDSLEIYQEYGQYLIWQKRFVESIALVEQGIRSYPKDDKLRILAAYVHFKLNNLTSFKRQIEIAQNLNPYNSEIYSVLAELWYEKKKPMNELEFLAQKAVSLKSKNKNVKPLLAWAFMQQDKLKDAVKLFEEFYDENPNEVFYADSLAEVYNRSVLKGKKSDFEKKALALRVNQQLKSDLDYFKSQNELDHTVTDDGGNRLPASLVDP